MVSSLFPAIDRQSEYHISTLANAAVIDTAIRDPFPGRQDFAECTRGTMTQGMDRLARTGRPRYE